MGRHSRSGDDAHVTLDLVVEIVEPLQVTGYTRFVGKAPLHHNVSACAGQLQLVRSSIDSWNRLAIQAARVCPCEQNGVIILGHQTCRINRYQFSGNGAPVQITLLVEVGNIPQDHPATIKSDRITPLDQLGQVLVTTDQFPKL